MTDQSPVSVEPMQSDDVLIQRIECLKTWAGYLNKQERDKTFDMILLRLRSEREQKKCEPRIIRSKDGKSFAYVLGNNYPVECDEHNERFETSESAYQAARGKSSSPDEYKMGAGAPDGAVPTFALRSMANCHSNSDVRSIAGELLDRRLTSREPCEWVPWKHGDVLPAGGGRYLCHAWTPLNIEIERVLEAGRVDWRGGGYLHIDAYLPIAIPAPYNPTGEAKPNGDGK